MHARQKSNTAMRSYLDLGCKGEHGEGCKTATFVRTYNKWMGKNIRRGRFSSGKNIRRGKIFVGEKYSSGKNFVGEKFRQLSKISSIFPDEYRGRILRLLHSLCYHWFSLPLNAHALIM